MITERLWTEVDVLWDQVSKVWKQADRVFAAANMSTQNQPEAEVSQHHIRFRTSTRQDRWRTAWKFMRMAVKIVVRGQAELKFKGRKNR